MTDDPRAAAFEQALDFEALIDSAEHVNEGNFPAAKAVLVAALLTAAPPAEGPTWQPIETGPKDGTWVLSFTPQSEVGIAWNACEVVRYLAAGDECWRSSDDSECTPTHWMPLPTPPRDPAGKE